MTEDVRMPADIKYDPYASPDAKGKLVVWDADKMEWREPTQEELVPALIELVLEMHRKIHNMAR